MDSAKQIVAEMVGDPGDVARFVRSALPEFHLDPYVVVQSEQQGGWMVTIKGKSVDEGGFLGLIDYYNQDDDSKIYYIDTEHFLDDYMSSEDWDWRSGAKWVKRQQRSQPVYYNSLNQAKRALLREPMVQRRIARVLGLPESAVESVVDAANRRSTRLDRIVSQLVADGWSIDRAGYHATGKAYVIGRGPATTVNEAVVALDTAADSACLFVEDIGPVQTSVSSPWQIDFRILEDEPEDAIDISPMEIASPVVDTHHGIKTRRFLHELYTRLKAKLPSLAVVIAHVNDSHRLVVTASVSSQYPLHLPKDQAEYVSAVSSLAAVEEVISSLGIIPYPHTYPNEAAGKPGPIRIEVLHKTINSGWLIVFEVANGPEEYGDEDRFARFEVTESKEPDVSMFGGMLRHAAEATPGYKDRERLHKIKDVIEGIGYQVLEIRQKPGWQPHGDLVDVTIIIRWDKSLSIAPYRIEGNISDALFDADINLVTGLRLIPYGNDPTKAFLEFDVRSYDRFETRRTISLKFTTEDEEEDDAEVRKFADYSLRQSGFGDMERFKKVVTLCQHPKFRVRMAFDKPLSTQPPVSASYAPTPRSFVAIHIEPVDGPLEDDADMIESGRQLASRALNSMGLLRDVGNFHAAGSRHNAVITFLWPRDVWSRMIFSYNPHGTEVWTIRRGVLESDDDDMPDMGELAVAASPQMKLSGAIQAVSESMRAAGLKGVLMLSRSSSASRTGYFDLSMSLPIIPDMIGNAMADHYLAKYRTPFLRAIYDNIERFGFHLFDHIDAASIYSEGGTGVAAFEFTMMLKVELPKEFWNTDTRIRYRINLRESNDLDKFVRGAMPSSWTANLAMSDLSKLLADAGMEGSIRVSSSGSRKDIVMVSIAVEFTNPRPALEIYELVPYYAGQVDHILVRYLKQSFGAYGFTPLGKDETLFQYNGTPSHGHAKFSLVCKAYCAVPEELVDKHGAFIANVNIGEAKDLDVDEFMQGFMRKWRVGKRVWGEGTPTYFVFKGFGDKHPDHRNSYVPSAGSAMDRTKVSHAADYFNWLEIAFMPSEKMRDVRSWFLAADLAGMAKKWKKLLQKGKITFSPVEESEETEGESDELLQGIVHAAIPALEEQARLTRLSHRLLALGCSEGRLQIARYSAMPGEVTGSIYVQIDRYPAEWDGPYGPEFDIVRPILVNAVTEEFGSWRKLRVSVGQVPYKNEGIAIHARYIRPGDWEKEQKLGIAAKIGQDAEFFRNAQFSESDDPSSLFRHVDLDGKLRKVVNALSMRMHELGAQGIVFATRLGPDDDYNGHEKVEVQYRAEKLPQGWEVGVEYRNQWSDLVQQEMRKIAGFPTQKMMSFGQEASSVTPYWVWTPYSIRGRFLSHKPIAKPITGIVTEGMSPEELYRQATQGSKFQVVARMKEVANLMHRLGYVGIVHVRPSQYGPTNAVIFRLYKPRQGMDPDIMKRDIKNVWKKVWGEDKNASEMGATLQVPVDWLPHHYGISMQSSLDGYKMQRFSSYGFMFEGLEESQGDMDDLYRKSMASTKMGSVLIAQHVADDLLDIGYNRLRIHIQPIDPPAVQSNVIVYVFGVNAGDGPEARARRNTIAKTVLQAVQKAGYPKAESLSAQLMVVPGSPAGTHIVTVFVPTSKLKTFSRSFYESMDPDALFRQSIKGTYYEGKLMLANVGKEIAKQGWRGKIHVGPGAAGWHNLTLLLKGETVHKDTNLDAIRKAVVDAFRTQDKEITRGLDVRVHDDDVIVRGDVWAWPGAGMWDSKREGTQGIVAPIAP